MANRFLSINDLMALPPPRWLIDGLFERDSQVMVAGPPGSYKSFLGLDWLLCIATGRSWLGRKVETSKVLYALGEGKSSLLKRIETWGFYHKITPEEQLRLAENLRVTFEVPQLASKASVDNMLAGLEAENFSPTVIVVDTLARSFVGMNENDQRDAGLWIESADRLRHLGYTVIFLHHTNKNTEFGLRYRGSSALLGGIDTAYTFQRDPKTPRESILTCIKQKDHDEGDPILLQSLIVRPDPSSDGSIVLVPAVRVDERFTDEYKQAERLIENLILDNTYENDAARAKKLAFDLNLTEGAAQVRISRTKKRLTVPRGEP